MTRFSKSESNAESSGDTQTAVPHSPTWGTLFIVDQQIGLNDHLTEIYACAAILTARRVHPYPTLLDHTDLFADQCNTFLAR